MAMGDRVVVPENGLNSKERRRPNSCSLRKSPRSAIPPRDKSYIIDLPAILDEGTVNCWLHLLRVSAILFVVANVSSVLSLISALVKH
jgi:hypothetical protein